MARSSPVSRRYFAAFGPASQGKEEGDDSAAEFHLGLAESAVLRRNREIAGDGKLQRAAGHSRARPRCVGFGEIPEAQDDAEVAFSSARRNTPDPPYLPEADVEIESSGKCAPGAVRPPIAPHAVVHLGRVERGVKRRDHRHVDRVQLVGAIERQERDRAPAPERTSGSATLSLLSRNQADFDCV